MHCRKNTQGKPCRDDVEGSTHLVALADSAVGLHRPDEDDPFTFVASCARAAEDGFDDFTFRWENVNDDWGLRAVLQVDAQQVRDQPVSKAQEVQQAYNRIVSWAKSGVASELHHAALASIARADVIASDSAIALAVKHSIVTRSIRNRVPWYKITTHQELAG
jgi:hypothetical protein